MTENSGDLDERHIAGLRVQIDRDTCIGSGNCTKVAPEVFDLDDELIATFRDEATGEVDREKLLEAVRVCPVYALLAYNQQGKQEAP